MKEREIKPRFTREDLTLSSAESLKRWEDYCAAVVAYNREWGEGARHTRPLPEPVRVACLGDIRRMEKRLYALRRPVLCR